MAYDEGLAERVRARLEGAQTRKMFGGLVFLVDGAMAVGVYGDELLVRAGDLPPEPGVRPFRMGARTSKGFVLVAADRVAGDDELEGWIAKGLSPGR